MAAVGGIEGLADLRRVLRKMESDLANDLRDRLKDAAQVVADDAIDRAPRRSGRLARSIKPLVRGNVGGVAVSARARDGYAYPKRLEYERGSRGRPFLEPALEAKQDEVAERVGRLLDDLADDWSRL